jgi:hypothetical protein
MFTKEFIEQVAKDGINIDEVRKLHPLQAMQLGLAVRQFEEQKRIKKYVVNFDNDEIGKILKERVKNVRNY